MKLRTEIEIAPLTAKIGYENRIMALGSCFAEHIAARLVGARFRTTVNPSGMLFNPLSITEAIRSYAEAKAVPADELHFDAGLWFHYGFHGAFSATSPDEALVVMNAARQNGVKALREADRVLITFGTAWVFERGGEIVANCHKQSAEQFVRRRLSVEEIVGAMSELIAGTAARAGAAAGASTAAGALAGKQIILTVSPVRHLGDGLQGNSVSKAVLRLAAEQLAERFDNVHYFPAYEILCDDLRDYRFYADDMVHPSRQAVEYVWEKFAAAALTDKALALLPRVESIVRAAAHRPHNPGSASHIDFCREQLAEIAALPAVDFSAETEYFRRCLEKI